MSEAKLIRENNDRDLVESCSKRRGVAESFTQLETRPRSVITSDCEVEEEDCEIDEDFGDDMSIGQFNLLPPIDIATARLAAARINEEAPSKETPPIAPVATAAVPVPAVATATMPVPASNVAPVPTRRSGRLSGKAAEEDAVLRAFIKAPKFADLATRSKAAASTQAKDKSQLKTSYQMFEDVLDNGTYAGYRKSKDGGKCNADSLRQRISSLARTVRGEHHRVKISENDMAPILQPDDLMDFKGRFALMWKVVDGHDKAAFKAGEAPCGSQAATQPAASEPGPSSPLPAKRSKRTKAEQAAEPTQPTKDKGKGKGKAA
ncbi:hypothetical protein QJQ45_012732 [Haematococcus lacustris]|nr:hypothetical protein QJQ45_012732 [Haematococcus lacustris]